MLKIGSSQQVIGEFDLGSVADPKRRRQIVDIAQGRGHPRCAPRSRSSCAGIRTRRGWPSCARLVADKLKAMEALKNELMTLKAELAGSGG